MHGSRRYNSERAGRIGFWFALGFVCLSGCSGLKDDVAPPSNKDASSDSDTKWDGTADGSESADKRDAFPDPQGTPSTDASDAGDDRSYDDRDTRSEALDDVGMPDVAAEPPASDANHLDDGDDGSETTDAGLSNDADGAVDDVSVEPDVAPDIPIVDDASDGTIDSNDGPLCVADCPALGQFRCADDSDAGIARQVQVCSLVRGCLQWLDTAVCRSDEACCNGACMPLNCDEGSCPGSPGGTDGSCGPAFDIYVDANAATAGNCTMASPCRTVTAGIDAALANPVGRRRILVAPGKYDISLGERFPLNLKGGMTVVGGGNNTVIEGSGLVPHTQDGGDVDSDFLATVMMGDAEPDLVDRLSNVQIRPDPLASGTALYGIVCDRGNALDDAIPTRPGATLSRVDLGAAAPGGTTFDFAVLVTNATIPTSSGCYLRMTESTVHDAKGGVQINGCANKGSVLPGVGAEIGNASLGAGNEFRSIHSDLNGFPIFARACTRRLRVESNTFVNSDAGILVIQAGSDGLPAFATVIANRFETLGNFGLDVQGPLIVDEFRQNSFTNISSALTPGVVDWPTPAVVFDDDLRMNVKARDNLFIGNDIGLQVRTYNASAKVSGNLDFGSTADPGNNTFRCNSWPGGPNNIAGDIVFEQANNAGPALSFEGNFWDRSPPSSSDLDGSPPKNGVEIWLKKSHPAVEVKTSALSDRICPANHLP